MEAIGGSRGKVLWHGHTPNTRLGEGLKHQGQGTLRDEQVDVAVCVCRQNSGGRQERGKA